MKPSNHYMPFIHKWLRYKDYFQLSSILSDLSYRNIAIYGGGVLGELLFEYLYKTDINVKCIIDRDENLVFPFDVNLVNANLLQEYDFGQVDAIIITILDYYDASDFLSNRVECPVMPLQHFIVDIDELDCLKKATDHLSEAGVSLFLMDMTAPIKQLKNPSLQEMKNIFNHTDWKQYLGADWAKMELVKTYYSDLNTSDEEYIRSVFRADMSTIVRNGITYLQDVESQYFNVIDGSRHTTDVPANYDSTIFIYGNCAAVSFFTEDQYTVASFLQRCINDKPLDGKAFRVQNNANWQHLSGSLEQILGDTFHQGDIVVLINHNMEQLKLYNRSSNVYFTNIADAFDRPHEMGEVFFDGIHVNHRGYKLIAKKVYSVLADWLNGDKDPQIENHCNDKQYLNSIDLDTFFLRKQIIDKTTKVPSQIDQTSLYEYLSFLGREKSADDGVIGAIVLNCNPFTNGHKYLVEEARKNCDFLYIFVVEEDKSQFSFSDRFMLVKEGVLGYDRVKVLPSGNFILSSSTLPEYFMKDYNKGVKIDASRDLHFFSESIAPALNISKRFVGEEPIDPVTRQYNRAMHDLLPQHGIEVVEIPRVQSADGRPISASYVRKMLSERNFSEIAKVVPQTTLDYLRKVDEHLNKIATAL